MPAVLFKYVLNYIYVSKELCAKLLTQIKCSVCLRVKKLDAIEGGMVMLIVRVTMLLTKKIQPMKFTSNR